METIILVLIEKLNSSVFILIALFILTFNKGILVEDVLSIFGVLLISDVDKHSK